MNISADLKSRTWPVLLQLPMHSLPSHLIPLIPHQRYLPSSASCLSFSFCMVFCCICIYVCTKILCSHFFLRFIKMHHVFKSEWLFHSSLWIRILFILFYLRIVYILRLLYNSSLCEYARMDLSIMLWMDIWIVFAFWYSETCYSEHTSVCFLV